MNTYIRASETGDIFTDANINGSGHAYDDPEFYERPIKSLITSHMENCDECSDIDYTYHFCEELVDELKDIDHHWNETTQVLLETEFEAVCCIGNKNSEYGMRGYPYYIVFIGEVAETNIIIPDGEYVIPETVLAVFKTIEEANKYWSEL